MATAIAAVACIFLAASIPLGAHGYAKYWWDPSQGVMPDGNACNAHPERAYPELEADGFWLENPHGLPQPDPEITFKFRDASHQLVTSLCRGANYSLQGSFPVISLALLSASEGRFLYPAPTPGCPNRVDWGASLSPRATTLFNATFAVPCNASDTILFRVTSAPRGWPNTWAQASIEMTVGPSCAVTAACPPRSATGGDPPRASKSKPAPPPARGSPPSPPSPPLKKKKKPPPPSKKSPSPTPATQRSSPPLATKPSPQPAPRPSPRPSPRSSPRPSPRTSPRPSPRLK